MGPKEIGKELRGYENLREQRINTSPPMRRRPGPITRQPSASQEIRLACIKGDLIAVQNLIEAGRVSVNCLLDDGWSPLMIAASAARPAVIEYLLLKKADPNLIRKDNFTALMAVAGSSQQRMGDTLLCVTLLLQAGSHINAKDSNGVTPLGYAVKENKLDVAKSLISAGANVDSSDRNGRSSLFYAAEKGHGQLARLLLEHGASIETVDKNGWMVGEAAVGKGHYKLGELLFRVRESHWTPGESPSLMTSFKEIPEPVAAEPDPDIGEGIVNILTNIQSQVKCIANLINSVRIRMVQDASTKEYEVETGKMGDLIVFAKSMGKSCSVLSNQVSSLNILLDGETRKTTTRRQCEINESAINCMAASYENNNKKNGQQNTPNVPRRSRQQKKSTSATPPPSSAVTPASHGYISSNYYTFYKKQQSRGGWNVLMAGAVSFVLLCYVAPQVRHRMPTMKLWQT